MVEGILAEGAVLEFIQLQLLEKGGLVMMLIGLLSIIAAVIVIERLLYFKSRGADEEKLLKGLSDTLERGLLDQAKGVCDQSHAPLAAVISAGIARVRAGKTSERELRDYLQETASLEIPKEERFLSALGTIAHIAPLLGLLGTVTGNIRAFGVLGELGAITDPSLLSRGISEALLTTAAGIIVSIPAIIFYNFLVNKVNHRIIRLENRVTELASLLVGSRRAAAAVPQPAHNGTAHNGATQNGTPHNGAVHNGSSRPPAAATPTFVEHPDARRAPAPAAPVAGQPGVVPVVAASMPAPRESPPPRLEPAAVAHPALAPHAGPAPPSHPSHPSHHQAAPAFAAQPAVAPAQYEALPLAPAPARVEVVPVHGAAPAHLAAPSQFDAVPPPAAPVQAPAPTVPTRVVAVPTHVEAVPAT